MSPQLQQLLHDKRFLYAGGAVAAAGAFVLYRRKAAAGSSTSSTTYDTAGGGPARLDTTGTDVATWLGNYSGNLQNQLDEYKNSLTGALAGLGQLQPTTPAPVTSTPITISPIEQPGAVIPAPAAPPPPTRAPAPSPWRYVTVTKFTSRNPPWNSTLSGIAGHEHTSVSTLLRLNPSIKNANLIYPNQRIRVA